MSRTIKNIALLITMLLICQMKVWAQSAKAFEQLQKQSESGNVEAQNKLVVF